MFEWFLPLLFGGRVFGGGGGTKLVAMRNQVLNGWRQIDVQLKRRHDLIPNLVNTVRGAMDFERDTLTAVMEARAKALGATGPADAAQKEGQLSQALGRLLAVAENYPDAQVEREREDAAGGIVGDREQGRLRAAVLQRHRHEVQHGAAGVSDEHLREHAGLQAGRALRDRRAGRPRRADGRFVPKVPRRFA